ncbi:MAG: hypothetical protein ACI9EF_000783 [Pseudohongiellaceae bacterium]|jgi:hypothetical protein
MILLQAFIAEDLGDSMEPHEGSRLAATDLLGLATMQPCSVRAGV